MLIKADIRVQRLNGRFVRTAAVHGDLSGLIFMLMQRMAVMSPKLLDKLRLF
jgi:hypothetical protein